MGVCIDRRENFSCRFRFFFFSLPLLPLLPPLSLLGVGPGSCSCLPLFLACRTGPRRGWSGAARVMLLVVLSPLSARVFLSPASMHCITAIRVLLVACHPL